MTDYDYNYIWEEIDRQEKIEFEINVDMISNDEEKLYEQFKWL